MTVIALLLSLVSLAPQLPLNAIVAPNTPFRVAWDHDGLNTDGFRWRCDGAIVANFTLSQLEVTPPPSGSTLKTFTAIVPGLAAGKHACSVVAYSVLGDSDSSNVVEPLAATRATAPVELRFVIEVRK